MTARARHQRILALLKERLAIGVAELATELGVSQNTIRNDLDTLAKQGLVIRTHGGASIPTVSLPPQLWPGGDVSSSRGEYIVKYAASRVGDGDSLILGDCPLCIRLAERITQRRNLRVITPSLPIAYLLAQEPSNKVVLVGGVLDRASLSTTGSLTEAFLKDFRAGKAFFSCSGVSVQNGLTDANPESARLKREMRVVADLVFVLVESERVGKIDLFPVAGLGEVSRIVTDDALDRNKIQSLVEAGAKLTVCGPEDHKTYRESPQDKRIRIGFANLSHGVWFAQKVRQGLEEAAQRAGRVELLVVDNETDPVVAERNAEMLLKEGIDLLIEYDGTGMATRPIMRLMRSADIPVIAVDIPITGAHYVGCDHDAAGIVAGQMIGRWIAEQWGGTVDRVWLVTCSGGGSARRGNDVVFEDWNGSGVSKSLEPILRLEAAFDVLSSLVGLVPEVRRIVLPGDWKSSSAAIARLTPLFAEMLEPVPHSQRIAAICLTDEVALALAQAVRQAQRSDQVVAVSFGTDNPPVRAELSLPDTCLLGTVVLRPECYGEELLRTALRILDGEVVPPAIYIQHGFVSREDVRNGPGPSLGTKSAEGTSFRGR